jgi:hypothetical protein
MLDMLQKKWLDDRTDIDKLQEAHQIPPNVTELKLETEAATGMLAMETLLTSQMDAAMELFMAWSYRNAFTVGEWGGVVLVSPSHAQAGAVAKRTTPLTLDHGFLPSYSPRTRVWTSREVNTSRRSLLEERWLWTSQ